MKQKITLIGLMLFFAAFTFGQNNSVENHRKSTKSSFEKHLKASGSQDRKNNHEFAFKKSRINSESTLLKSTQTIKQKLDSLIGHLWNKNASQWVADDNEKFTYDANGNMTQYLHYAWNKTTSRWVPDDKNEYTYNADGNVKQYLHYNLVGTTSQWMAYDKEESTYDANGNETKYIYYKWDETTSQWVAYEKEEYTYDVNGNDTLYHGYEWDETTSQWVVSWKTELTYNANGNVIQYLEYNRAETTSQWVASLKTDLTYDANGNITQYLDYNWDETASQWVANHKDEATFDASGNLIQYIAYNWNKNTSQWVEYWKREFTYNNTYSYNDLMLPYYYIFNHMLASGVNYEKDNTNNWLHEYKYELYYSEQVVTSINDIETEDIQLFPNPVSEYLNISFRSNTESANFELFDILGQKLISRKITNNEQLSLENLNNGMYLYNLYIDGTRQSGKLIKK